MTRTQIYSSAGWGKCQGCENATGHASGYCMDCRKAKGMRQTNRVGKESMRRGRKPVRVGD
jgi:hypothetical protein